MNETSAPPSPSTDSSAQSKDHPGLVDSLHQVNQAGQQTLDSATQTLSALRDLLSADLALARSALRKALLWSAAVVVFATPAWLCLLLATTVLIAQWNVPLPVALLLSGLISLMATVLALGMVKFYLRHTDLAATRRQLAKLHWPETKQKPGNTPPKPDTPEENTANGGQGL